jgi:hypothetical protein
MRHSSSIRRELEWQGMCSEAHSVLANKQQQQQQQLERQGSRRQRSIVLQGLRKRADASEAECDAEAAVLDPSVTVEQGPQAQGAVDASASGNSVSSAVVDSQQVGLSAAAGKDAVRGGSVCDSSTAGSDSAAAAGVQGPITAAAAAAAGARPSQGGTGSFWPALIIMLHLTVLRSFNGFVNIMYFTALLFSATGNSTRNSLLAQTLMGMSTLLGGCAAMLGIDKVGATRD